MSSQGGSVSSQPQMNSKQLKKKLVRVLQDKIEQVREKQQSKKRELKLKRKQTKGSGGVPSEGEIVTREVLIRLKPLTEASRELIVKERKKNCLMQFRLKV